MKNKNKDTGRDNKVMRRESMLDYVQQWEFKSTDELVEVRMYFDNLIGDHPEKAVTLRDNYAEAWDFLAMQFVDNEQFTFAAAAFEKAAQGDPQFTRA